MREYLLFPISINIIILSCLNSIQNFMPKLTITNYQNDQNGVQGHINYKSQFNLKVERNATQKFQENGLQNGITMTTEAVKFMKNSVQNKWSSWLWFDGVPL